MNQMFFEWTEETKKLVWEKGEIMFGWNSYDWRKDDLGNIIKYSEYGNRNSNYGWEVDHIVPKSQGGSDKLHNLRPLQWYANVLRN